MKIEKKKQVLYLKGRMIIETAEEDIASLLKRLHDAAGGERLQLDLSGLTELDAAGVQLLVALAKSMKDKKGTLELLHLDDNVKSILHLSGIDKFLKTS
jgi:anti-anti-sigma factor